MYVCTLTRVCTGAWGGGVVSGGVGSRGNNQTE